MKNTTLLFILIVWSGHASSNSMTIYCERLIDVVKGEILYRQEIEIAGERILEVRPRPENYLEHTSQNTIELKDHTCMPGLMDMHVHIITETNPDRFVDRFRLEPADFAYSSIKYSKRTLEAGFTLVRDLGSSDNLAISLRNAIDRGDLVGPRILAAGKSLATTGGHADPTNGLKKKFARDPGPKQGVVNGPIAARKGVRQRYKEGADLIKITATGGVLSQAKSGQNAQFSEDELEAIVSTAKDYGFKIAAHAHGDAGMRRAVIAGVSSIEHGTLMSQETMRLMKKYGTYYVPTIIAGKFVAEKAKEQGFFSELVRPKALAIGPKIQDTFARAYKVGVKIAFGTDSGVSPHGQNWKEFEYMVEAGMPAMEAIQSATIIASDLAGNTDQLGSIEKGKLADIIAVEGNPLENISMMGQVQFVMKGGTVYKN